MSKVFKLFYSIAVKLKEVTCSVLETMTKSTSISVALWMQNRTARLPEIGCSLKNVEHDVDSMVHDAKRD